MLDPALGTFDHVVAMDSLIHYNLPEMITALEALAPRVRERMLVTVVPGTPLLVAMRAVGRLFPKADRAPAIVPISERAFRAGLLGSRDLDTWGMVATRLIERGFYRSMAIALHHSTMGGRSGGVTSRRR
jgi:magnesium-protoporphyrin O-methyltransferase